VRTLIAALAVLGQVWWAAPATAALIETETLAHEAQGADERARLEALIARPEVAKTLQTLGVPPESAAARVRAMTDAEVRELAGAIDRLPAGGALSNNELLIIVLLIILIVVLI
jgi:hypothetical protein